MDKVQRHSDICQELNGIYSRKNHDYDDAFGKSYRKLGEVSALTRMYDKLERLIALHNSESQVDESKIETLNDLANYAIMYRMEIEIENGTG